MHEDRLVDAVVEGALAQLRAAPGATPRRLLLELSPDSHMDEMSVRIHLESHLEGTPLAGVELAFRHVPPRLRCAACDAEFERAPGQFTCPRCGKPGRPAGHQSGLRLLTLELA